jgi:hypothetical protein
MCARSHRESLAINELPDIKANSDRELRRRTRQLWSRNAGFAPHGDNRDARVQYLLGEMYQHAWGKPHCAPLSTSAFCYAASLKSPICASSARLKATLAVQRSI